MVDFLDQQDDVNAMFEDIAAYLERWIPSFSDTIAAILPSPLAVPAANTALSTSASACTDTSKINTRIYNCATVSWTANTDTLTGKPLKNNNHAEPNHHHHHKLGLHARAAALLAKTAGRFGSDIKVEMNGQQVDAKSVMSLMLLAASKGTEINLHIDGNDKHQAMETLIALIENRFDEEE